MIECPKCNKKTLEYNKEWDYEYDRLFEKSTFTNQTLPKIRKELARKEIYYAKCQNSNCNFIQLKHSEFEEDK